MNTGHTREVPAPRLSVLRHQPGWERSEVRKEWSQWRDTQRTSSVPYHMRHRAPRSCRRAHWLFLSYRLCLARRLPPGSSEAEQNSQRPGWSFALAVPITVYCQLNSAEGTSALWR